MKVLLPALCAAILSVLAVAPARAEPPAQAVQPPRAGAPDPFLWLEEVEGERALAWVDAENAKAQAALETDPRYEGLLAEARAIFTADDRIATPSFRAGGID
ncbi:MAG: S9 family peptidase, partial [Caulobacteraceae bacterium]|nr:S9 family peptidase [Caulobacteraceae bacterium]